MTEMKEPTGWKKLGICAKQLARAAHNPIGVAIASEKNLMPQRLKRLRQSSDKINFAPSAF
jgi:hypothetical protein